jgi:hypothetical protein
MVGADGIGWEKAVIGGEVESSDLEERRDRTTPESTDVRERYAANRPNKIFISIQF